MCAQLRAKPKSLRLTLDGVGAMNSPRYAAAGLLVEYGSSRVMIDGGPGATTKGKVSAWLVTDERGELMREIRKLARLKGLEPWGRDLLLRWAGCRASGRSSHFSPDLRLINPGCW